MKLIKSAIPYMGNKFKILNQIQPYIPENINTMYDVFCGSGVVSINTIAKSHILTDSCGELMLLHDRLQTIQFCESVLNTSKHYPNDKESYLDLRRYYNEDRRIEQLLILVYRSFSNQMRFSKIGDFNVPYGDRNSLDWMKLITHQQMYKFGNYKFFRQDFRDVLNCKFKVDDFVFLDPPYFNSVATYNSSWNEQDELDLYELVSNLPCKWMMTNTLENRGVVNPYLSEFIKGYNVYPINSTFNYDRFRASNVAKKEVIITNYEL